jgi:beta-galactosidase
VTVVTVKPLVVGKSGNLNNLAHICSLLTVDYNIERQQSVPMPTALPRLAFGGDYSPEQWPVTTQVEDIELMRAAGVDLVTVGVFSWALLQPGPDEFTFGWLDEVVDRLHAGGIAVDLATATASPPPWLSQLHPEMLPVTADGTRLWPGGRQAYCPSSPVYRSHALALVRAMAERYGGHPALALWHVSNEIGGHNSRCYCDVSAAAFRAWLRARYHVLDRLNEAWGTAFWSQHYTDWEQILPPRSAPTFPNPTQQLDFHRFSSDTLLELFVAERDVLHELSPGVPVTTNFMVMTHVRDMDYFRWARELDVVSQDHYLIAADPEPHRELAFCSDLTRGVAGGKPWLLMEQSTSAVNWQPRNVAKRPGELLRASLQHVARGADGVLFFQWRASRAGAEKFHAGLVPHAGTDTRVWREVVELSRVLDRIEEVVGSTASNRVALLFDWEAWWATELDSHPSTDVRYVDRARALHAALVDLGVGVDVVHPGSDLSGYGLLVVPTLYLVTDAAAAAVREAVEAGASALVTYFSGIVDESDHLRLGGYPGAFRDLLGVRVEEFTPLLRGETVRLDDGSTGDVWTEDLRLTGATAVASYVDGPVPGRPAVTRHEVGSGIAWYAATRLDDAATAALVGRVLAEAGIEPVAATRPGVEVVRRVAPDGDASWVFVINHTAEEATVALRGRELVSGHDVDGLVVAGGGVAVVRET